MHNTEIKIIKLYLKNDQKYVSTFFVNTRFQF